MVRMGIEGVCLTYESDPAQSATLLRRMLEPGHLAAHGYEELPALAHQLGRLLLFDPRFVEEVYRAAVGFREESDASVQMGQSQIMGFTSTRRQDYGLALHALGELFPRFMEAAPVQATGAVIAVVEAQVAAHANVPIETMVGDAFQLGNAEARIVKDLSSIWDANWPHHSHEIHIQMLDAFENGLVRLATSDEGDAVLGQVLDRITRENRFAAVWRRLLSAAAREPRRLGLRVWPLASAVPVLVRSDTLEAVGWFLTAIFPILPAADRETIERAILSMPIDEPETAPFMIDRRDRLLGCLGPENVVTDTARGRLEELAYTGGPPPNAPLLEVGDFTWQESSEAGDLAHQGVPISAEPNRKLLEVTEAVGLSGEQFQTQEPAHEQVRAMFPAIETLYQQLSRGGDGADARVLLTAWTRLAGACSALAGAEWLEQAPEIAARVRSLLLEISHHACPQADAGRADVYEQHGALSPSPRWHAAEGLLRLARFASLADGDMLAAIRELAQDPCVEIRGEVARGMHVLYRVAPDTFWELLGRLETVEASPRVIRHALHALQPVARHRQQEMVSFARTMFNRFRRDSGAAVLRCACLAIVVTANGSQGQAFRDELIETVFGDLTAFVHEAIHLVHTAGHALTAGLTGPPDPGLDGYRASSIAFYERFARTILARVRELESLPPDVHPAHSESDLGREIEAIRRIAHDLGMRLYFSFATAEGTGGEQDARRAQITDAGKRRFLGEAGPLLELLADLPFPDVVHRLLETLERFVPVDPRAVFLMIARAVRRGQSGGYHLESLGADLVVQLVRRYLADYRSLFRDDSLCRAALMEVLDAFVGAGWPQAMALTYRLDEIFR
jgi:hypothetical protein